MILLLIDDKNKSEYPWWLLSIFIEPLSKPLIISY